MTFALLALLAAAATVFVLQPVFGSSDPEPQGAPDRTAIRLTEKRDQLLLALAELDFEKDAGKIGKEEHQVRRARLLAEAAAVTARLDEVNSPRAHSG